MLQFLLKNPLPIAVSAALIGIVISLYGIHLERESLRDAHRANVHQSGEFISDIFRSTIYDHVQTLENLKGRIEETQGDYFNYWEYDAALMLNQYPSFILVQWIDSSGVIQRIEPDIGNEEAVGLDILTLDYRRDDWLRMKRESQTNITPWTELVQGGGAFLVDVPLYFNDHFQGSITAGMDFTAGFNQIMIGREMFNVKMIDDQGVIFYNFARDNSISDSDSYRYQNRVSIDAVVPRSWEINVTSNTHYFSEETLSVSAVARSARFVVSILFGIVVFFMLTSIRANQVNRKSLREKEVLISEIHHRVKNNLAVISGLIEIQLHDEEFEKQTLESVLRKIQLRINSIAGVHELLYDTDNFTEIPLESYLLNMFDHLNNVYREDEKAIRFDLDIKMEVININQAVPLGMLFSELFTNSFKHAFQNSEDGNIQIKVKSGDGIITVIYRDTGIGLVKTDFEKSSTIGLTLIKTLLRQLDADYFIEEKDGFCIQFSFKEIPVDFSK